MPPNPWCSNPRTPLTCLTFPHRVLRTTWAPQSPHLTCAPPANPHTPVPRLFPSLPQPRTAPQTDLRMPRRLLRALDDGPRMAAVAAALRAAVADASRGGERDVRVLLLGSGGGLLGCLALRAGAQHVTCVER